MNLRIKHLIYLLKYRSSTLDTERDFMKKTLVSFALFALFLSLNMNSAQAACTTSRTGFINCDNGVKGLKTDLGNGSSFQNFNNGVKSRTTTNGDGSKITRFNDGRTLVERNGFKPKWVK